MPANEFEYDGWVWRKFPDARMGTMVVERVRPMAAEAKNFHVEQEWVKEGFRRVNQRLDAIDRRDRAEAKPAGEPCAVCGQPRNKHRGTGMCHPHDAFTPPAPSVEARLAKIEAALKEAGDAIDTNDMAPDDYTNANWFKVIQSLVGALNKMRKAGEILRRAGQA